MVTQGKVIVLASMRCDCSGGISGVKVCVLYNYIDTG